MRSAEFEKMYVDFMLKWCPDATFALELVKECSADLDALLNKACEEAKALPTKPE